MKFFRERRHRLIHQQKIIDSEIKLARIKLAEMRKLEAIKSSFFVAEDKLISITNLEEQQDDKAIELATREIEAIINQAEKKALQIRKCRRFVCPFCQKTILFGSRLQGNTVICPNNRCRHQIKLPG